MSERSTKSKRSRHYLPQLAMVMFALVTMFTGLLVLADRGATYVPFRWEKSTADTLKEIAPLPFTVGKDEVSKAWAKDLQNLIGKLAKEMDMPEDIEFYVDYSPNQMVNAVAFMGGQVIVFDGLINIAQSENALSFVLAHEMAHLKHRDGIRGLGRQGLISSAILVLFGTSGDVSEVANLAAGLSGLKYSRDVETAADEEAVAALARYYGHVNGMNQIFRDALTLQKQSKAPPEFLSSHPDFLGRMEHMEDIARQNEWDLDGKLTPMAFTMTMPGDNGVCTKSATLCRIEDSISRIRSGQMSLVDPDPDALEDALEDTLDESIKPGE